MGAPSESELLDALRHEPTSTVAFRRFGEWLKKKNDPWGELVLLSCDLAKNPKDKALARKVATKRKKLEETLLGKAYLERYAKNWWGGVTLEWAYGFVRRAELFSFDPEVYALFTEARAARGPIDLVVSGTSVDDPTPSLARHPLPWVRSLTLGGPDARWSELALGPMSAALPRESLSAYADTFKLEKITSKTLARMHLDEHMMSPSTIEVLRSAKLPSLETLALDIGRFEVNEHTSEDVRARWQEVVDAIERLAKADPFPKLRRLALRGTGSPTKTISVLAKSPLGKRLEALDVSQPVDGDAFERDARDIDLLLAFDSIAEDIAATSMKIHLVKTFARRQSVTELAKKFGGRIETSQCIN